MGAIWSAHLKVFFANWLILECEISVSEDVTADVTLHCRCWLKKKNKIIKQ